MRLLWERPALLTMLVGLAVGLAVVFGPAKAAAKENLKEGQPAPDVELPATQIEKILPEKKDAKTLHLKDLQGKKNVVLYFFPKASTLG